MSLEIPCLNLLGTEVKKIDSYETNSDKRGRDDRQVFATTHVLKKG